jgi:hypothetical protein
MDTDPPMFPLPSNAAEVLPLDVDLDFDHEWPLTRTAIFTMRAYTTLR